MYCKYQCCTSHPETTKYSNTEQIQGSTQHYDFYSCYVNNFARKVHINTIIHGRACITVITGNSTLGMT